LSLTFTLGFCFLGLWLLAFWCGKFLEGKRITKGIAEGKRMAKDVLIESLHQEL
jgi:hypothetical protein